MFCININDNQLLRRAAGLLLWQFFVSPVKYCYEWEQHIVSKQNKTQMLTRQTITEP